MPRRSSSPRPATPSNAPRSAPIKAGSHAVWIPNLSRTLVFETRGQFIEHSDGSGTLTGVVQDSSNPSLRFFLEADFDGLILPGDPGHAPSGSPKKELGSGSYAANGGPIDPATWRYYTTLNGTLTGEGDYHGALVSISRRGPAMQVGVGANGKNHDDGVAVWLHVSIDRQPDNQNFTLDPSATKGDINLNLDANCANSQRMGSDGEDIRMRSGVDDEIATGGLGQTSKRAASGEMLEIVVESPNGTFDGEMLTLVAACRAICDPVPPSPFQLTDVYVNPNFGAELIVGPGGFFGPDNFRAGGNSYAARIPAGVTGFIITFQSFAITSRAANGYYAASEAHDLILD